MSKKKVSELRVFKLRSGEEIIAKIAGKARGKVKLQRPMKIVNNMVTDPLTGSKKHMVYFCDWLGCSTELVADIPADFIVVDLPPDPDMVSLYSRQLEIEDTGKAAPLPPPKPKQDDFPPMTDEELKSMISSIDKQMEDLYRQYDEEMKKGKKPTTPKDVGPFGVMPTAGPPLPPPGILFSIGIPNEVMNQWLENGILDYLKDCMEDFMDIDLEDFLEDEQPKKGKKKKPVKDSKWKEPSEDDKKKPGFGNRVNDWSPFVKDYLDDKKEPPQEKKE